MTGSVVRIASLLATVLVAVACGASDPKAEASAQTIRLRLLFSGLDSPTHLAAPRSDPSRLYVVEQPGRILLYVNGRQRATPFLDIRNRVTSGGEQGMLSVAFHPGWAKNRRFYVDYTDTGGDTRVVQYRANKAGTQAILSTRRQLLFIRQPYANHNGGQLAFGPDGWLYVGMGDGGSGGDPENRAQNLRSLLGKLLRLNVNAKRPRPQIVGYGLRNPWRFSFDRANGDLYIGDVGQEDWEEIDYTPRRSPGLENYGWRIYEGRARFRSNQQPNPAGHLVFPVEVYSHEDGNCSVTGGFVYRGSQVPAMRGRYIYGDYCSGLIWTLRIEGGRAVETRRESVRVEGLSSFGEDARGELYAVSLNGRVYKITG
jgi:glucose/arabinose dehydrogenase